MSKSPSLRRIQADVRELALDPSDRYYAAPLENDMFEWHFTIRGADGTDFEGGVYHGRILLPPEYPLKPPHIMFLTPSGRFETNTKVCLSFSAYHPELWQPAWGIRLILEALISFLPTPADGAIGALDWSSTERKRLAKESLNFTCKTCCSCGKKCKDLLPELKKKSNSSSSSDGDDDDATGNNNTNKPKTTRFAKEIEALQKLQLQNEGPNKNNKKKESDINISDKESSLVEASAEEPKTTAADTTQDKATKDTPTPKSEPPVVTSSPTTSDETAATTAAQKPAAAVVAPTTRSPQQHQRQPPAVVEQRPAVVPPPPQDEANHPIPDMDQVVVNNNNNNNDVIPDGPLAHDDPSWMYDPLLNLMMILLAAICYLLIQKYQDLLAELQDLREYQQQ